MYYQISILFLEKSYNHIFDMRKVYLSFFLRKPQESYNILLVQLFLDWSCFWLFF